MITVPDSPILFEQIQVGSMKNFCYIVAEKKSREAAVFDPAFEVPKIVHRLERASLNLKYIINTHSHHDHVDGNSSLKKKTKAKIVMSYRSPLEKQVAVRFDGQELMLGRSLKLRFLLTPGHSPESMCIVVNDYALITGDTLFIGECGRVDLPGGDASELYDSFVKIKSLNPNLLIYPGHDYGSKPFASLQEQIDQNYTLARRTREEFMKFMSEP